MHEKRFTRLIIHFLVLIALVSSTGKVLAQKRVRLKQADQDVTGDPVSGRRGRGFGGLDAHRPRFGPGWPVT